MIFFYLFFYKFFLVFLIGVSKKSVHIVGVFFCSLVFSLNAFSGDCNYEFDLKNSVIQGTGYKFTEKTGVSGHFSSFKLSKNEKKENIKELLKDLVVTVDLTTLDSGNPVRDKNMRETLFAGLSRDSSAIISVKKVTDKTIETHLKINDRTQKVIFDYSIKDEVLTAQGRFDALEYAFGKQIEKLKKRCGLLHTGKDGKSVTWTDFALEVTAKIIKTCRKKKKSLLENFGL